MNKKFILKKISKNIFQISEPWNFESCNIYLFKKNNNCLIFDTGLGLFSLKKFLNKLGIENFLVALTHSHFDHIGGISDFKKNEYLIPEVIKKNIYDQKNWCLQYLKKENFNPVLLNKIINRKVKQVCDNFNLIIPDFIPIKTKSIRWFDYNFKIMHLGGHSKDSCIYYEPEYKILISGDLLYNGEIYANCHSSDKKQFLRALNIISKLDFKIVLTGHNEIMNHKEALKIINKWLLVLSKKN
ncbi:MAG: MBL fold metallo-hydrolase [Candidatus Moraniibacteriota bacterium]